MSAELAIEFITLLAFLVFAGRRLMRYLHILQQDDYDNRRLLSWMFRYKVFDRRISIVLLLLSVAVFFVDLPAAAVNVALFLIFALAYYTESDPRKAAKKAFVLTPRARRILIAAMLYTGAMGLAGFYFGQPAFLGCTSATLALFADFGEFNPRSL